MFQQSDYLLDYCFKLILSVEVSNSGSMIPFVSVAVKEGWIVRATKTVCQEKIISICVYYKPLLVLVHVSWHLRVTEVKFWKSHPYCDIPVGIFGQVICRYYSRIQDVFVEGDCHSRYPVRWNVLSILIVILSVIIWDNNVSILHFSDVNVFFLFFLIRMHSASKNWCSCSAGLPPEFSKSSKDPFW